MNWSAGLAYLFADAGAAVQPLEPVAGSSLPSWLLLSANVLTWLSYVLVPVIVGFYLFRKPVAGKRTVLIVFTLFFLAGGAVYLVDAVAGPAVLVRVVAAVVSIAGVVTLFRLMPEATEWRDQAALEQEVERRTRALREVNDQLNAELMKRKHLSESLRASNDELLAFSYSVSHDLRAPLRSIHGFSHALLEDYKDRMDEEGKDYLRRICSASSRMGELIDDILKLSKLSRNEVIVEEVDLSLMVQEIISSQIQRNPGIKTSFEIESDLKIQGDQKLMKIALENLIDNAIKYSAKVHSPVVRFGKIKGDSTFFVQDNGAGFDMQFADKLFGPFQRLHDVNEFEGSGIGLATVKRIILKHGGRIWADAKVKQGATFYFSV